MTGIVAQNVGRASGLIKSAGGGGGVWTLIKTLTGDGSGTALTFADGSSDVVLDSTYPIYVFKWINIHPSSDNIEFQVNFRDGSTAYDATKTSSAFRTSQAEDDSGSALAYQGSQDLAQSTGVQVIAHEVGNDNDQTTSGYLYLFNPSSTTFMKHFLSKEVTASGYNQLMNYFIGGYCNVTAAIDGVQFSVSSGNIDAGQIKLYGLGDS